MRRGHPSDRRLHRWLDGEPGGRSSNHIDHCPLCQERLDQLTELEPQVRAHLDTSLTAPSDLERRVSEHLERRLADRETLSLLTDLMNTGLRTSQVLIEGDEPEQREEEDSDG